MLVGGVCTELRIHSPNRSNVIVADAMQDVAITYSCDDMGHSDEQPLSHIHTKSDTVRSRRMVSKFAFQGSSSWRDAATPSTSQGSSKWEISLLSA
jgi:hypothetical protein